MNDGTHSASCVAIGGNYLLAALPPEDMRRLRGHLEPVPLVQKATLYEAGSRLRHLYFPTGGIVSLMHGMAGASRCSIGRRRRRAPARATAS